MKSCETEQLADACRWRIFGSLWNCHCVPQLYSCVLTGPLVHMTWQVGKSWASQSVDGSLSPSQRQKVSAFSCWHHDPKTNAEIKDSLKINPHCVPSHVCVLLQPVSNGPVFVLLLHLPRLTRSSGLPFGNPQHTVFVSDALHYKRGQRWHWNKLDWQD